MCIVLNWPTYEVVVVGGDMPWYSWRGYFEAKLLQPDALLPNGSG